MIVINSIEQLKIHLISMQDQKKIIGFVPTMGALHAGHISLINRAKAACDVVICSIFVNPTQFNDLSDLDKYPRTVETDCRMLEKANCDIVFVPEVMEMYTEKELELKRQKVEDKSWAEGKRIDFGPLEKVMEGAHRQGHFNGVAQVVSKLFRIVQPQKAYFGQKDFQQLAIIKSMVKQLDMPIEIVSCAIIREPNGLAMSSRNERLTAKEREIASIISKTLFMIREHYQSKQFKELMADAEALILKESSIKLEYLEIADAETLQPVNDLKKVKNAVACIAVKIGEVRLIDNVVLY
jgi:pantoate--beta-alanine ligase